MHIQVDGSESGAELYHLSILFQSLAGARGFAIPKPELAAAVSRETLFEAARGLAAANPELTVGVTIETPDPVEPPATVIVREPGVVHPVDIVATVETPEGYGDVKVIDPVAPSVTMAGTSHLDVNRLPWDARIHAGSRERNTDGSWRVRRKPKTVEQDEWDATLARVTAELTDLMAIPVSPGAVADAAAETAEPRYDTETHPINADHATLTDAEVDAFVDIVQGVTEPVVVAPPVTIAPPVVVPPVTAVAPPITVDKPAIETFAQLMSWLTSRTPKDEAAKPAMVTRVNEILAANGLTTLQQLGQRSDLIPQVLVQFQAAFGE